MQNGKSICYRFHTLGSCFPDCKHSDSHVVLTGEEVPAFINDVKSVMEKLRKFKQGRNNLRGGYRCHNQQVNTPTPSSVPAVAGTARSNSVETPVAGR